MIIEIKSYEQFKEVVDQNKNVIVDCYADWCGPCRMLAPELEKVSEKLTQFTFVKVNIDNVNEIADEFQIYSIPLLLCIKQKQLIHKLLGYKNEETLIAELSRIL